MMGYSIYDTIIEMIEFGISILIFSLPFLLAFVRKVPTNTVIIIDRNGHYLKTLSRGFYILGPFDEITTRIAKTPTLRVLTDFFETDDGKLVSATVSCRYHADNITNVLQSLGEVRRSVDDIIKSAAHFAISNFPIQYIIGANTNEFSEKVRANLVSEFNSIGISLSYFKITVSDATYSGVSAFRPHESSCYREGNVKHNHEEPLIPNDKYNDGPIIYK